ncbi:MAG TPA: hypothetical protein VHC95_03875 [Opitutales bacterium]|nr:hypothetical protein [Opitutales bacterium]
MSLLQEIQNAAIDGSSDIETVLRKCRLLAARLKHEDFKNWVQWELDGYPDDVDLPDYREFHGQCYGHFSGPFGSGIKNAQIPESCIPNTIKDILTMRKFRGGIGSLAYLVNGHSENSLRSPWPADAYPLFHNRVYERMVLIQAWVDIPKNVIVGMVSTVRNRILNFAIEIEASNPDAGEASLGSVPVPEAKVTQIFNTNIYGNVGNVSSGHNNQQTATINVTTGNSQSLANYLKAQGVDKKDIKDLENAIDSDPKPIDTLGENVSQWIQKMLRKSAEGTWGIAKDVAKEILTSAVMAYYGIPRN